jgi:hypothetical protein
MSVRIDAQDPRYSSLLKGHNLRWPASPSDAVRSIEICENTSDVASALQRTVDAGLRPTVRSGGHCYEDFVANNPGGVLLDLSLMTASYMAGDPGRYRISAGKQLGDAYLDLFKRHGVTIPAGSCYTVGAGGHITGGGYGLLSRLHGLTVDWLSAVDIVTIDANGKAQLVRANKTEHADLFRACRGAGGGNFGVITAYYFDKLPIPPQEVINGGISFDWAAMTEARFVDLVLKFGDYWATRGTQQDTWGLFSILNMSHDFINLSFQFCNPDGSCRDLSVLNEFLDRFEDCNGSPEHLTIQGDKVIPRKPPSASETCPGPHALTRRGWLEATVEEGGGSRGERAKYKSAYMKQNFTAAEAKRIYKHMTRTGERAEFKRCILAIDSFGGAVNRQAMPAETSCFQRSSIMKLQFLSFWEDPAEDGGRIRWMREFYTDLYSGEEVPARYAGTPYPGQRYEGCYINYPDNDMLAYSFWPQLYYGEGDLYPFLQDVKQRYDPHNVFHHAMSIRPKA